MDVDFSSKATLPMPIELVQKSFQMLTQQTKQMTQEMKQLQKATEKQKDK